MSGPCMMGKRFVLCSLEVEADKGPYYFNIAMTACNPRACPTELVQLAPTPSIAFISADCLRVPSDVQYANTWSVCLDPLWVLTVLILLNPLSSDPGESSLP